MQKIIKTDSIFIAGQSGMVGSAITRKVKENGYQNLLVPSRKTLDLLDYKTTENWFKKYNPNVVILAAAKVGGINANFKFSGDFILENLKFSKTFFCGTCINLKNIIIIVMYPSI